MTEMCFVALLERDLLIQYLRESYLYTPFVHGAFDQVVDFFIKINYFLKRLQSSG